jgi:hypothetical protein
MPVIARFCGIVIRLLPLRLFGPRLHAFHGNCELVLDLQTLSILHDNVSESVRQLVLAWAAEHQKQLLAG